MTVLHDKQSKVIISVKCLIILNMNKEINLIAKKFKH
jgi:hypothetical protein